MTRRSAFSIAVALAATVSLSSMIETVQAQGVSISIGSGRRYSGFRYYSPYRGYSTRYGFRSFRPVRSYYYATPGYSFRSSYRGYSSYPLRSYSYSYGPSIYSRYSTLPYYSNYYVRPGYTYYTPAPYGFSTFSGIGISVSPFCVW